MEPVALLFFHTEKCGGASIMAWLRKSGFRQRRSNSTDTLLGFVDAPHFLRAHGDLFDLRSTSQRVLDWRLSRLVVEFHSFNEFLYLDLVLPKLAVLRERYREAGGRLITATTLRRDVPEHILSWFKMWPPVVHSGTGDVPLVHAPDDTLVRATYDPKGFRRVQLHEFLSAASGLQTRIFACRASCRKPHSHLFTCRARQRTWELPPTKLWGEWPRNHASDECPKAAALQRLASFDIIGDTSELDAFARAVAQHVGRPLIPVRPVPHVRERQSTLPRRVNEVARALTRASTRLQLGRAAACDRELHEALALARLQQANRSESRVATTEPHPCRGSGSGSFSAQPLADASSTAVLLAIGVLSVPVDVHRRRVLRAAWLHKPWAGEGGAITAHFVVRSNAAPPRLDAQLRTEEVRHADLLRVAVPWNESRVRGPVLTLAAFLAHAAAREPRPRHIAKVDDDAFVHVPDLAAFMQTVRAQVPGEMHLLGPLSWFSWFPQQWERIGFDYTYRGAARLAGRWCHNATWAERHCGGGEGCGECVGPFPFVSGYLLVLSGALAAHLATKLTDEVARLKRTHRPMLARENTSSKRIMEDVWLGSLVHRFPPREPLTVVSLTGRGSGLVADLDRHRWQSLIRSTTIVVHVKSKEPRVLLALRRHMRSASHCSAAFELGCGRGCAAFGAPSTAVGGPAFCSGATKCRIVAKGCNFAGEVDIKATVWSSEVTAELSCLQ